ncbi:MAG: response regulator transcription factor [Bdellovibrio sp.]|jgi:DNA-binding response OmpR family regulator
MQKVLVIDDAEEIFVLVRSFLADSAQVVWAPDLAQGRKRIETDNVDLILLDVTLPDGNGFHFFTEISNKYQADLPSVIFLTAKSEVAEKVLGLSLGADDYITKSSDLLEMKARIEVRLRKLRDSKIQSRLERVGPLEIQHDTLEVYVEENNVKKPINLTKIEFKILCLLVSHKGELTTRDEILDRVWGKGFHVYPRSVDTHVSNLRKKLPSGFFSIENVHGQGYRLVNASES